MNSSQVRLFLEEICCDLCRFRHVSEHGLAAEDIRIRREVRIGTDSFADILVEPPGNSAYYLEVKVGYPLDALTSAILRKYGESSGLKSGVQSLVLLVESCAGPDWDRTERQIRAGLSHALKLQIWTLDTLRSMLRKYFSVRLGELTVDNLFTVRDALDQARWKYAFDQPFDDPSLAINLLWHFSSWKLRHARDGSLGPRDILRPGLYSDVVVVMADLCRFSTYVRQTEDDALVRDALTAFYSKARYEILNSGGMLYQFVGDQIIGLFGIPEPEPEYVNDAFECARALMDIGDSVSLGWRRRLANPPERYGLHTSLAMGDVNLMPLRPFSRRFVSLISDTINVAARLVDMAGPGELAVTEDVWKLLPADTQRDFGPVATFEARNIGELNYYLSSRT